MAKNTHSPKNEKNDFPKEKRTDPTAAQKGYNEQNVSEPEGAFPPDAQKKKPKTKQ